MKYNQSFDQYSNTNDELAWFSKQRAELSGDPFRPLFHFSPPGGYMNDPNGFCYWHGNYHLFYQYDPTLTSLTGWGHAISDDLLHWRDMPLALRPEGDSKCYSGQVLVEDNRVIAMYHSTGQGNSIAISHDDLLENFVKSSHNPVIPLPNGNAEFKVFDPCIWKDDDTYYALSGSYGKGRDPWSAYGADCRNTEYLFSSRDLIKWEYLGIFLEGGFYTEPGEDGAVPNFLPIGKDKYILLFFSHKRASQYYIGNYDKKTHAFKAESHGRMNYGLLATGSLHAPSATIDTQNRLLAIFNVKEGLNKKSVHNAAWSNVMTLPRVLSLSDENNLEIKPIPEIKKLRSKLRQCDAMTIPRNQELTLKDVCGKSMELELLIDPMDAREVGLYVFRSADGVERTRISLYRNTNCYFSEINQLQIDISEASSRPDVIARPPECGPLRLKVGEMLHLRIFLDQSIIEVYANNRQCLTLRAYPGADSDGVSLFARGAEARLISLHAWQLNSIYNKLG